MVSPESALTLAISEPLERGGGRREGEEWGGGGEGGGGKERSVKRPEQEG